MLCGRKTSYVTLPLLWGREFLNGRLRCVREQTSRGSRGNEYEPSMDGFAVVQCSFFQNGCQMYHNIGIVYFFQI